MCTSSFFPSSFLCTTKRARTVAPSSSVLQKRRETDAHLLDLEERREMSLLSLSDGSIQPSSGLLKFANTYRTVLHRAVL